jgi:hypothetical protein
VPNYRRLVVWLSILSIPSVCDGATIYSFELCNGWFLSLTRETPPRAPSACFAQGWRAGGSRRPDSTRGAHKSSARAHEPRLPSRKGQSRLQCSGFGVWSSWAQAFLEKRSAGASLFRVWGLVMRCTGAKAWRLGSAGYGLVSRIAIAHKRDESAQTLLETRTMNNPLVDLFFVPLLRSRGHFAALGV